MVANITWFTKAANSLSGDDVRLSKRVELPSRKLRGFEKGKIGPVDSNDFVGGNYASVINLSTTLPTFLPEMETMDIGFFLDVANVWGVDYDSSIDDSNKIRSAAGLAMDWHTPIGPLTFTFAQPLTKASTDKTESFRFNLGTTF